jgi:hypothetical protein
MVQTIEMTWIFIKKSNNLGKENQEKNQWFFHENLWFI